MKTVIFFLFLIILSFCQLEAHMAHRYDVIEQEWKEENLTPFNELILSWNGARPKEGKFLFYVSVKTNEWSSWLLYASWGSEEQSSFLMIEEGVKVYQDILETIGEKATAFQVKIVAEGGADLNTLYSLHVYTNGDKAKELENTNPSLTSINLKVLGLSQMALDHPRHADLCSPTSTTAVTRHLLKDNTIDPISFAEKAWDKGFDLFGNWVFNAAQASTHLGNKWGCWVERLNGFNELYSHMEQGAPVIVSVRGPLKGSATPYSKGHLLVVTGYDSLNREVICMDPAFHTDSQTHVSYDLIDFLQAWARRGNLAYIFKKTL